jgi:signal transduction histidine kinase
MRFGVGSLSFKLLAPLASALLLLTIAVTAIGIRTMRLALISRAEVRSKALAEADRDLLASVIHRGEHAGLAALIAQMGRNPDLAAIRLLDPRGRVRASSVQDEIGTLLPAHVELGSPDGDYVPAASGWRIAHGIVHNRRPFENDAECRTCHTAADRVVAYLDVDVAVNEHRTGVTAFSGLSLAMGIFYFVAVAGIALPVLQFVVVRPLSRLIEALHRVEAGDLSASVAPSGTHEVDAVAEGFNRMADRLRRGHAAEQEAQRLHLERAEQLAAVGQMAAGLAHEIRNPLSSVRAVLEVVSQDAPTPDAKAILRDATGELDRLDRIVSDLLQYARPRSPTRMTFDLNALVSEVAAFAFARAVAGGGSLHIEAAGGLPPVEADPDMVRQVLVNLVLNAEQAIPPGTTPEVTITTGRQDGHAWCRVRDNGPGVPRDKALAVFQPFTTTKTRGTGLGLSISRRVMEVQGGRLTLDNPGEPGASFTFTVPLAPPPERGPSWLPTKS